MSTAEYREYILSMLSFDEYLSIALSTAEVTQLSVSNFQMQIKSYLDIVLTTCPGCFVSIITVAQYKLAMKHDSLSLVG